MRRLDMNIQAVADSMGIDAEQAERRKAFLQLGDRDCQLLRDFHERLGAERTKFVDEFYDHLLAFDDTRRFVEDPETLARLKHTQLAYLERLTAGCYDWDYILDRLRLGVAHHRLGLELRWYLSSYVLYLRWLLLAVLRHHPDEPQRALDTFAALLKVAFLDIGLAVDTYIHADREALVAAREYAEKVLATVPSGLLVLREDLRVALVNRAFRKAFGVTSREVVGRPLTEVLPVDGLRERVLEVMTTGKSRHSLPFELREPGGGLRALRITISGIRLAEEEEEEEEGLLLVVDDVTAEVERDRKIRIQAAALEAVADSVTITDREGVIVAVNRGFTEQNGYRPEEVIGKTPAILKTGETPREVYADLWSTVLAGHVWQGDVVNRRKDGSTYIAELTVAPVFGRDGRAEYLIGTHRDITERRRAEEALRRSERSFRTLIEQTPDAIAVHRAGRFVYVNPAMVRLLGYESHEDLVGQPVSLVVHPQDRETVAERLRTLSATGKPAPPREERFLRKDGSIVHVEVIAMPLEYQGEPAIVTIGRDITERKELTARMMSMDRMIAVGTLAAGVGHEINNPLTYVNANLGFALEGIEELKSIARALTLELRSRLGERAAEEVLESTGAARLRSMLRDVEDVLRDARDGGNRIRDIVRDLKTFSRGDEETREPVRIHGVIDSAIDMAYNEIRHRARLVKDYEKVPPVLGNESRLGQVFLNLLVNAAHAIKEGAAERNEIRVRTASRDGLVVIEVRDTGTGIRPDDLPKVFDPFFTTKPIGQGTGLGLAICRQIVASHGGRIEVESELGKGSVFRVFLPPAPAEAMRTVPTTPQPAAPTRRGRILVVDDEPMITRVFDRALGQEHDVTAVTSARAALDLLEAGQRFDLLFCDLMMPDMTGMDLHEELVRRMPEQAERVVFMTGGAFTPNALKYLEQTPNLHVQKPFDAKNLRALVRDLLRGRPSLSRRKNEDKGGP